MPGRARGCRGQYHGRMFGDLPLNLALLIFASALWRLGEQMEAEERAAEREEEERFLRRYLAWKRAQREDAL